MNRKPVIAIACNLDCPVKNVIVGVYDSYVKAVEKCGGLPLIIPAATDSDDINRYLEMSDGLLVPGGKDVHPMYYGARPNQHLGELVPDLDEFQIRLIRMAHEMKMPIFGICRGLQMINVALGGTLIQHLPDDPSVMKHVQTMHGRFPFHSAEAADNSLASHIFGDEPFYINSFHHQAVEMPAPGLKVSVTACDGVIEALESEGDDFIMGVQWHPERMIFDNPAQYALLETFIEVAARTGK